MGADGSVTIECLADTSKFDLQMEKLERRIEQAEKNKKLKFTASQRATRELEDYKQQILEIEQEFEKVTQKKEQVDAIMRKKSEGIALTPTEFSTIQDYNNISNSYEKIGTQLDKMYVKQENLTAKVQRTTNAYELADDKVKFLKRDLELLNYKKGQEEINNVNSGLSKSNFHLDSILKKTARWILALFSVRSVMSMISRASSIIAQYDKQYASNLEYIQYALAMAIKPVLEWIVKAIYTILGLVNSIFRFFTGRDLFKTADAFASAKNSLASGAKSAKEINKNLTSAGFDELSVLQDTSSTDTGGASSSGVAMPTGDLTKGFNIDWMESIKNFGQWVKENWKPIVATLLTIGGVVLLFKLLKKAITPTTSVFKTFLSTIGKAVLAIAILRWTSISYTRNYRFNKCV